MNIIAVLGLFPFLIYFLLNIKWSFYGLVPLIVYINGILYHGYFPNSRKIKLYDIIVNGFLCIYINLITKKQPYIFIISFFTTMVFLLNTMTLKSDMIHVICIQWILLQLYIES